MIKGAAGNFYTSLDIHGTKVLLTYTSKGISTGANLIAFKKNNKYYLATFKRNKFLTTYAIKLNLTKDLKRGLLYLIEFAEKKGIFKKFKLYKDGKDFAKQLIIKEVLHKSIFDVVFPELKEILEESKDMSQKVDKFVIIYDPKLKDIEKKSIVNVVQEASKLVKSFGLAKILYGKVAIVDAISGARTVADYEPSGDFIRISKRAKKNRNTVRDFIHELGHRLMRKDMVDKPNIMRKYSQEVSYAKRKINVGDIFLTKDGKKLTIKELRYKRKLFYIFEMEGKKGLFQATDDYFIPLKKTSGKEKDKPPEWIPSTYSMKNYGEWFSEIFADALINNNKLYKDFVKSVLN